MKWRILLAVLFGLSMPCVATFAEGPPGGPGLDRGDSPPYDAELFDTSGFVRFQLVQGRLLLDPPRHRQGTQHRDDPGIYESITVTSKRGLPSLHYICQTPQHHLTLSVHDAGNVRIESWFRLTGERSTLTQPAFGPIRWELSRGDLVETHQASTLLHLRRSSPTSFDEHYKTLVERILRGRNLDELVTQTHLEMVELAQRGERVAADQVQQWVDDLGANRQATRAHAEGQLLACGTVALPLLLSLASVDLDAEQRHRLRGIIRRIRVGVDDTPASLAMLLVNDRGYWATLAPTLDTEQVGIVNAYLRGVGVEPVTEGNEAVERIASAPVGVN